MLTMVCLKSFLDLLHTGLNICNFFLYHTPGMNAGMCQCSFYIILECFESLPLQLMCVRLRVQVFK